MNYSEPLLKEKNSQIENKTEENRADSFIYKITARIIDILVALFVLAITWPIILVIAFLVRRDTAGPAIFKQKRVGRNQRKCERRAKVNVNFIRERRKADRRLSDVGGKPFVFYKFRTMFNDARERYPELYAYKYTPEQIKKMYFKSEDDPRFTPFGKKIRMTSLDELPNVFNLLKGEVSLVGPRPDIPEMVKYYADWQRIKFNVKPGVTGLAQTNGRGLLTFQQTLAQDVEYVRHRSMLYDLMVIAKTFKAIWLRIGAF